MFLYVSICSIKYISLSYRDLLCAGSSVVTDEMGQDQESAGMIWSLFFFILLQTLKATGHVNSSTLSASGRHTHPGAHLPRGSEPHKTF